MTRESSIESLVARLTDALRAALPSDLPGDLRERLRPMVESAIEQAQLVPREEFERQLALLERLEEQARRLEARLAVLETSRGRGDVGDAGDDTGGDARL
jgi:BMFP domain-containing protein YqiC